MTRPVTVLCMLFLFSACRNEPSAPHDDTTSNVVTSPARPALTFYNTVRLPDSSVVTTVNVMDADMKNPTVLTTVQDSTWYWAISPSWSPTGNAVAFMTSGYGGLATHGPRRMPDTIKVIEFGVNSVGRVVPKNTRVITGISGDNGAYINNPAWSSTPARNQIAYIVSDGSPIEQLCVISAGDGNTLSSQNHPIVVRSFPATGSTETCTWNSDDTKLAAVRRDNAVQSTIMIFNTADWSYVDSIHVPGVISGLEWSRAGMNKLAFGRAESYSTPAAIYYCDPKTGATPTTNGLRGCWPSWSPDNTSIVYWDDGMKKMTPFTRNSVMLDSSIGTVAWKH